MMASSSIIWIRHHIKIVVHWRNIVGQGLVVLQRVVVRSLKIV